MLKRRVLLDPLAPLQPLTPGKDGGQLQIFRMGGNLETSLYLAQATGSYVYTDVKYRWRELQSAVLKRPGEDNLDPWSPVVQALDNFYFIIYLDADPRFLCRIKENGDFKELIGLYRRIFTSVRNIKDPEQYIMKQKSYYVLLRILISNQSGIRLIKITKNFPKGAHEQGYETQGKNAYQPFNSCKWTEH